MHEPECRDGIEWWPESAPTPIDVSTLPASGAISTAKRLPGSGQWVGLWGDFAGARIAFSATESFAVGTGAVFPYPTRRDDPEGVDLYFSKDTGASGTMSIGRFKTMAAARAWVGLQISLRSPGGGGLGPFPAASALADADPNPTTTRVGSNVLIWNGTTWDRAKGGNLSGTPRAAIWGGSGAEVDVANSSIDAAPTSPGLLSRSFGYGFRSDTSVWDRLQTLPAGAVTGRAKDQDAWQCISSITVVNTNNVGVTTMYTVPAGKIARVFLFIYQTAFTGAATFELTRSGGTFDRYITAAVGSIARNLGPILLQASATLNVSVTAGGVGSVNITHMIEERWAE